MVVVSLRLILVPLTRHNVGFELCGFSTMSLKLDDDWSGLSSGFMAAFGEGAAVGEFSSFSKSDG